MLRFIHVFIYLVFFTALANGQCAFTVNTFPYNENFENSTGGWISGGTNNDWAWGNPNKIFIQNAGTGNNCWVTGSLNGSFYNYAERSYVYSPCFNFTNVQKPHVKFKIYWEGENQYDGTCFQYSLNNGTTWNNVGAFNDPMDCFNQNWFNQSNITNLNTLATPKHGWAGTILPNSGGCIGGGGSGAWVLAQHCMSYLAGQPSVQFRFAFGAGTTCNDFDGVAFDDITIGEAPPLTANYSFVCNGQSLGYDFTSAAPCASGYSWNFGDPGSGSANNTSNLPNPTHLFSSPGNYTVTLTVTGPCNTTASVTYQINTLDLTISTTNLLCYGVNIGTITANAVNSNSSTQYYNLQPNNISNTTGYFSSLAAASYNVVYLNTNNCMILKPVSIYTPTLLVFTSLTTSSVACAGQANATVNALVNGGVNPKNYVLLPNNITNTTGIFPSLGSGTYTVAVTDANGCTISSSITVTQTAGITISNFSKQDILCYGGATGQANISVTGGSGIFTYTLQPGSVSNASGAFQNLTAGNYTITASDANGCTASTVFILNQAPSILIGSIDLIKAKCSPPNSGSLTINASNGVGSLQYSIGGAFSSSNTFNNLSAGNYNVIVMDANNCSVQTVVNLGSEPLPVLSVNNMVNPSCNDANNGSVDVDATSSVGITGFSISGGGSNTTGIFTGLSSGTYTVTVTDANLCTNSIQVTIVSPGLMVVTKIVVDNDSCSLEAYNKVTCITSGGTEPKQYRLTPGGWFSSTGEFVNLEPDTYYLQVKDTNGCTATGKFEVTENLCCNKPFVPNAFSPNGDGLNDELKVKYFPGVSIEKFLIMNRFGQVVFSPQHVLDRWDGKFKSLECEIGSYYYLLQYKCTQTQEVGILKGDITLLR